MASGVNAEAPRQLLGRDGAVSAGEIFAHIASAWGPPVRCRYLAPAFSNGRLLSTTRSDTASWNGLMGLAAQ